MKLENVMLSKRNSYMMLFYKISSIGLWGGKSVNGYRVPFGGDKTF